MLTGSPGGPGKPGCPGRPCRHHIMQTENTIIDKHYSFSSSSSSSFTREPFSPGTPVGPLEPWWIEHCQKARNTVHWMMTGHWRTLRNFKEPSAIMKDTIQNLLLLGYNLFSSRALVTFISGVSHHTGESVIAWKACFTLQTEADWGRSKMKETHTQMCKGPGGPGAFRLFEEEQDISCSLKGNQSLSWSPGWSKELSGSYCISQPLSC